MIIFIHTTTIAKSLFAMKWFKFNGNFHAQVFPSSAQTTYKCYAVKVTRIHHLRHLLIRSHSACLPLLVWTKATLEGPSSFSHKSLAKKTKTARKMKKENDLKKFTIRCKERRYKKRTAQKKVQNARREKRTARVIYKKCYQFSFQSIVSSFTSFFNWRPLAKREETGGKRRNS